MGEAIVKGLIGVALIYAGNVLVNEAVHRIGHELDNRKVWRDAVRSPEPIATEFEQRQRTKKEEESPDAD